MRHVLAVVLLLFSATSTAQSLTISAEQWTATAGAQALVHLPGVGDLMAMFERQPQGALVIYHATHDQAARRAELLRAWLVALGVPSARIALERDTRLGEALSLEVRAHGVER
jgi:hypothetical protein